MFSVVSICHYVHIWSHVIFIRDAVDPEAAAPSSTQM